MKAFEMLGRNLIFRLKLQIRKLFKRNGIAYLGKESKKSRCRWSTEFTCKGDSALLLGKLEAGTNSHFISVAGGELKIGNRCFFNRNCIVVARFRISIGEGCSFGPNVCIYDHDHSFDCNGPIEGAYKVGPVTIEENCWLGAGVIVLRNTHIGKNCVIGAGCIIQGDIPDNTLVTSDRELIMRQLK